MVVIGKLLLTCHISMLLNHEEKIQISATITAMLTSNNTTLNIIAE